MFGMIEGFWRGFWAPLHALKMIVTSPRLLSLVIVPLSVNIGLYILFFHYGAHYLDEAVIGFNARLAASLPAWALSISAFLLKILSWIVLAVIAALTFTLVSGIISAPFNDYLSKAAMHLRLQESGAHFPTPSLRLSLPATLWLEFKRVLILIIGAALAFGIGLIPLLQIPALMLGASLLAFEYFGYPVSHRSDGLAPVMLFTLRHPAVSLGFGSFLLILMMLPFTSIVYIPLAVVGGTVLYADLNAKVTRPAANTHKKT